MVAPETMGSFADPKIVPAGKSKFCEVRKKKFQPDLARGINNYQLFAKQPKHNKVLFSG